MFDLDREISAKFKQLGFFYSFADDEKFYLWFKKIPLTTLKVKVPDHDTVLAIWKIGGPSSNVFESVGIRAGRVAAADTEFSFEIHPPRPISVDKTKITQNNVHQLNICTP